MFLHPDSGVFTQAESVQVRSILSLARILGELYEGEKAEESEGEDECEADGENDEAEIPITPENSEISADLASRTLTIRARK
jgi:hypothetical protein